MPKAKPQKLAVLSSKKNEAPQYIYDVENKLYPIPTGRNSKLIFPFEEMEINQSFFIPIGGKGYFSVINKIRELYHDVKGNKKAFATRTITDSGGKVLGKRVWRIQ